MAFGALRELNITVHCISLGFFFHVLLTFRKWKQCAHSASYRLEVLKSELSIHHNGEGKRSTGGVIGARSG